MSARKEHRDRLHFRRQADAANRNAIAIDLFSRAVEIKQNPRLPVPAQQHRSPSKAAVRRWMRLNAAEYETATELAEACNAALDLPHEWLDDCDHWVWEIAATEIDIAECAA